MTYYLDPVGGSDGSDGTSRAAAWKSLETLADIAFQPGDKILLKAGCRFNGCLTPKGSGIEGKPIVIDRYGDGANPVVAGEGRAEDTIRLHNQSHWELRNLTVTNSDGGGRDDKGRVIRRAVHITAHNAGDVAGIHLRDLEIRDVRGRYRLEGHQTNGGIICRITGTSKKTRFTDLRIEGCTFRTRSIERYPVVVTSSWGKEHPSEVVYRDNTLDHTGRAYIVIPAGQWPRRFVYYYDPECGNVFSLEKTAPPISPFTGRVGCEDVFSEMAARLCHSWDFFEATRHRKGSWLCKLTPNSENYSLRACGAALSYYGELRALGFEPPWIDREQEVLDAWIGQVLEHRDGKDSLIKGPHEGMPEGRPEIDRWGYLSYGIQWQLRNRLFMADRYAAPPGCQVTRDYCADKESARKLFDSLPWRRDPYWACNMITKAIQNHQDCLLAQGKGTTDEVIEFLHERIDGKYNPEVGYWGGEEADHATRANGNMKILVTYGIMDWDIPNHRRIVDFILSGADERLGFQGRGCGALNQMYCLAVVRRKYPDGYRGEEIDRHTARTFLTFLENWDESLNFFGNSWNDMHNNGVPTFMPQLMLDLPLWRASTIYNWRETPVITRGANGKVTVNRVTYQTRGFPFTG